MIGPDDMNKACYGNDLLVYCNTNDLFRPTGNQLLDGNISDGGSSTPVQFRSGNCYYEPKLTKWVILNGALSRKDSALVDTIMYGYGCS